MFASQQQWNEPMYFTEDNMQHNAFISGKQTAIHISAFTYTDNAQSETQQRQKWSPIKQARKRDPEVQQDLYRKIINRLTLTSYCS